MLFEIVYECGRPGESVQVERDPEQRRNSERAGGRRPVRELV